MQKQLEILKEILEEEIAWYSAPYQYPSIFARFSQSSANRAIDGVDWVCWACSNQNLAHSLIHETFQKAFSNKEIFVYIGCSFGENKGYISVTGRNKNFQ